MSQQKNIKVLKSILYKKKESCYPSLIQSIYFQERHFHENGFAVPFGTTRGPVSQKKTGVGRNLPGRMQRSYEKIDSTKI